MDTVIVMPKNKTELGLIQSVLKKIDVKTRVLHEHSEHKQLKTTMLSHSKKFFIEKMD